MKQLYKKIGIGLLCIFLTPIEILADDRLKLPREINGLEILLGGGAAYDNTAYLGEKESAGFSPAFALMTDRFYLDIHQVSYRFYPNEDTILTILTIRGTQDALPNEEDIPSYLNIKSSDSYDVGFLAEKKFGDYRLEGMASVDVTGTHNGMLLELAMGYDYYGEKSYFEVTLGARYQDEKRNNYYYGVSTKESTSHLSAYEAKADLTAFLHTKYTYALYNNLGITFEGSMSSLSNTAKHSPRIKNNAQYQEIELFAGLISQFSLYN